MENPIILMCPTCVYTYICIYIYIIYFTHTRNKNNMLAPLQSPLQCSQFASLLGVDNKHVSYFILGQCFSALINQRHLRHCALHLRHFGVCAELRLREPRGSGHACSSVHEAHPRPPPFWGAGLHMNISHESWVTWKLCKPLVD